MRELSRGNMIALFVLFQSNILDMHQRIPSTMKWRGVQHYLRYSNTAKEGVVNLRRIGPGRERIVGRGQRVASDRAWWEEEPIAAAMVGGASRCDGDSSRSQ